MTDPQDVRMRAGDAERQVAVDALTEHFTAGRLTAGEYDERVRQAYASTYLDELPALLADLPAQDAPDAGAGAGRSSARTASWQDAGPWGDQDREYGPGGGYGPRGGYRPGPWQASGAWRGPGARRGFGGRPGWAGAPPRAAALLAIAAVVLLIVLSHGFVLFPLLWIGFALLFFGRRRGGCGRRMAGPRSAP